MTAPIDQKTHEFLNLIAQGIYDKSGKNILVLDVRGLSLMMDFVVICEGNVDRHTRAIAKYLIDIASKNGIDPYIVEGLTDGRWIVIDFSDIIVHLFVQEFREKYALEELWSESKIVDVNIITK